MRRQSNQRVMPATYCQGVDAHVRRHVGGSVGPRPLPLFKPASIAGLRLSRACLLVGLPLSRSDSSIGHAPPIAPTGSVVVSRA